MTQITNLTSSVSRAVAGAALAVFAICANVSIAHAQKTGPATPDASAPAAAAPVSTPAAAPSATPAADAPKVDAGAAPTGAAAVKAPVSDHGENPYGLKALWAQGDIVAKITLMILLIMSVGTWYILFTKLFEQSKMKKQGIEAKSTFWNAGTVRQGADTLKDVSPYRFIAESALSATKKHEGLMGQIDYNTFVTQGIDRAIGNVQSRAQDGLAFLATVGATAPFVGLFGTVWGIYNALVKIGLSGQASIDKVAGPVGESLIMTAIGLAVAVPAVLGYNWLVRRNKAAMDNVREFSSDLHSVLLSSKSAR